MSPKSTIASTRVMDGERLESLAVGLSLGIAALGLVVAGIASTAHAAPTTIPTDLNPGDQYRLVFVTNSTRTALSGSIDDYNAFVTTAANTQPELTALATTWKAIVSAGGSEARTNTSSDPTPAGLTGFPIYLLNDTRLADHYDDLWDASVIVPLRVNESGNTIVAPLGVWSGTKADGTGFKVLGVQPAGFGRANVMNNWIFLTTTSITEFLRVYAMSDVLTVPEPDPIPLLDSAGLVLLASALLVGGVFFMRRAQRSRGPR